MTHRSLPDEVVLAVGELAVGQLEPDPRRFLGTEPDQGRRRLCPPGRREVVHARRGRAGVRSLAVRRPDEAQVGTRGGEQADEPADAEHLVVGMGREDHDLAP